MALTTMPVSSARPAPGPRLRMWTLIVLSSLLSGCLPSSCGRVETRDISPSDSLSRAFVATLPVDTLVVVATILPSDSAAFSYPRTIDFSPDGRLWIADTESHRVLAFDDSNRLTENIDAEGFQYPYLAGFRADTLLVFSPDAGRIVFLHENTEVRSVPVPQDSPERGALQFAAYWKGEFYYKVLAKDFSGYIARFDDDGSILSRFDLDTRDWRYSGLLRPWGDSLVSLSGFLPAVDIITETSGPDSLALFGFDSPMLSRTRQFLLGDISVPPLLSASAASSGNYLFVLNMRPGWLNIDVYDHGGRLRYILTQPDPGFNSDYFPTDVAVRRSGESTFEFAIAVIRPEPRIDRFSWTQPE